MDVVSIVNEKDNCAIIGELSDKLDIERTTFGIILKDWLKINTFVGGESLEFWRREHKDHDGVWLISDVVMSSPAPGVPRYVWENA